MSHSEKHLKYFLGRAERENITMYWIYIISIGVAGIVVAALVTKRPEFFWYCFMGIPLVTAGAMIAGYSVIDEYMLGAILLGAIFAMWSGRVSAHPIGTLAVHERLFLVTAGYFIIESIRGAFVLGDIRIIRWILYYCLFGACFFVLKKWPLSAPRAVKTATILAAASSVYFVSYLGFGLANECIRGISRWNQQGIIWAGSSYALFVLIVSLPAAFYVLRRDTHRNGGSRHALGWVTLAASIAAIGYYDSRVGWLALFGFLFLAPVFFGLRRGLGVMVGILGISGLVFLGSQSVLATPHCRVVLQGEETFTETSERLLDGNRYKQRAANFAEGMAATAITPVAPRVSDLDRTLHLKAGFRAIIETPMRFLFGEGVYTHKRLLYPYIRTMYAENLPGIEVNQQVRTMGLPALAVDFGFVGLALLLTNLLFTVRACLSVRSWRDIQRSSVLVSVLLLVPFWLAVSNIQDIVVYFLLFMPQNPLVLLGAREEDV